MLAWVCGFVLLLCFKHWGTDVPWPDAAREALLWITTATVTAVVIRGVSIARRRWRARKR